MKIKQPIQLFQYIQRVNSIMIGLYSLLQNFRIDFNELAELLNLKQIDFRLR